MSDNQKMDTAERDRLLQKIAEAEKAKEDKEIKERNVDIVRQGKQIIIPPGMSMDEAGKWIARKRAEEEQEVVIEEVIEGYPLDAAYALSKAISNIYGWNMMETVDYGFWGKAPPAMIGVPTSVNTQVQVPWGRYNIPKIDGYLESRTAMRDGRVCFAMGGKVKKKCEKEVADLAAEARRILRNESIYKGKAIMVEFPKDPEDFSITNSPKFLDTSTVKPNELIFSKNLMTLVQANVFAPVERTALFRKNNIPLKIGVLLEGSYGTGKTLTAYTAAKKCEENGWTFVYLRRTQDLAEAIQFAKQYQPAMVFAEDIDAIMKDGRDEAVNELLNTIDGVVAKNSEIIVVLTTNHIEKINQAMLRPGRLDAVLSISPPDAEAVQRLIRLYGGHLIPEQENLASVGHRLQGQIPAVIREVVDRAKRIAMVTADADGNFLLTGSDLDLTAESMLKHLELLKPKGEDKRSSQEKAAQIVADGIVSAFANDANNNNGKVPKGDVIFKQEETRL